MHIITGGTGKVGSALAKALLKKGETVTIVSRGDEAAPYWSAKGAAFAIADIYDTAALHEVIKAGKSVFILNPQADPATDTSAEERKTLASLVKALKNTAVQKVVVASTIGAQPGDNNGDLGSLYELEQGISRLPYSYSIIRSAYYMSNWASSLEMARDFGKISSFFPSDLKLPMVAPEDVGKLAAQLMTRKDTPKINTIRAPTLYSAGDVAAAFSKALKKKVAVEVIPKHEWIEAFKSIGFSNKAAQSYARMTELTLNGLEMPDKFVKGKTSLQFYIDRLVAGYE